MELNPILNQAQRFLNSKKCVRTGTATVWKWGRTRLKLFGVNLGNGNPRVGILKGFFPGSSLCLRQRNMQSRNIVRAEGRSTPKWKAFQKFLAHVPFETGRGHPNDQWLFHTWTGPSFNTCPFCIRRCDKITKENIKKYPTVLTPFHTSNYPQM
jgi:hypothetical protein